MKILVVGAGMYVTGRGNTGPGVVLSSLVEASKRFNLDKIVVCSSGSSAKTDVQKAMRRINSHLSHSVSSSHFRASSPTSMEFLRVIRRENFDGAVISLPDHLHFVYAKTLMKAGIPVLLVKPMVPTLKEGRALLSLQEKSEIYGAVEFHKRWDEQNLFVKKLIANQELGDISFFRVDFSQRQSIPLDIFRKWSSRTNIFQYLGVHYVDLIYFLTGFRPVEVMGVGTSGILKMKGINTFDSVLSVIRWKSGDGEKSFISDISTHWIDPVNTTAMSEQKYSVVGSKGRLDIDQKRRGVEWIGPLGQRQINPYFSESLEDIDGHFSFGGYGFSSINQFVEDIYHLKFGFKKMEDLVGNRPTFKEALVSTAVIDAVNRSLRSKERWMPVEI